ncbi:MAG: GAF domain-containing protein [Oscillochloridaceae bacterium]|nr:GAF domain-containing protein [Chloroflexaceae bacterium]MDW8391057.1 GAF domain-containing protein [Oscillochloridaceae bacterium]
MRRSTARQAQALKLEQQRGALRSQRERDARLLDALVAISLAARERPGFRAIIETVQRELTRVFAFDVFYLACCDERRQRLACALLCDEDGSEFIEDVEYDRLTGAVIRTRQPLLVRDLLAEHDLDPLPVLFGRPDRRLRSWLGVPLLIGPEAIGVLSIQSRQAGVYTEADQEALQRIASVTALVLDNVALVRRQEQVSVDLGAQVTARTEELTALSVISAGLVERRPLIEMLERALEIVLRLFHLDAGNVRLLDANRDHLVLCCQQGFSEEYTQRTHCFPLATSPIRSVVESGEPIVVSRNWYDVRRGGSLPLEVFPRFECALILPLFAGSTVVGTLSLFGFAQRDFSAQEVRVAQSVANQIAILVENRRLLDRQERQIAELEAIGQIGKVVTASYDLDKMLAEVYRIVHNLLDASVFALLICEPDSKIVTNAVFVEAGEWIPLDVIGRQAPPNSLSQWIMSRREPLLFDDLLHKRHEMTDRGIQPQAVGPDRLVRSWAGVPVVARDGEVIGMLCIQDYRPYRYDSGTIDFLNQVASHVSLGVQKVRLFQERERLLRETRAHAEALERQAHRLELVNRMASVLAARLDQREILELAARELVQLFWADHTGTVLVTEPEGAMVVAEYPPTGIVGLPIPMQDNPLMDRLIGARRPIVIEDIEHDPLAELNRELWRSMGIRSLIIVPLVSRDRVLGSISLDSYGPPLRFSDEELELLSTVATSIAAAVDNAQLFAAEQEQRRTAETLREMTRVLSSTFDPNEVLRLVLGELQKVIDFDTASIMLLDGSQLRLVASRGRAPGIEPRNLILPLEGTGAGHVARTGTPLRYIAGRTDCPWMRFPSSSDILSWIGVPLIARGHVLGVLNIDLRGPLWNEYSAPNFKRIFSERDVEVASAFANHAALAIENARLYQESITRVEQELEIARRIQANLFPRQLPVIAGLELAARCVPARETGGDFYDVVQLGDRVGVIVGDVSGKSLPAAMLMAVARSTARSEARNHETPWIVLTETNRALVDDVPRNSFVALSYALVDRARDRLVLASAGQLTPLLRRANGHTTFLEGPPALPLGLSAQVTFGQFEVDLQPGDTVLFYTDGIVEAHDRRRNLFGFERLEQLLAEWGHLPAGHLVDRVLAEVHAFSEGMPPHDDMTLVAVRVT